MAEFAGQGGVESSRSLVWQVRVGFGLACYRLGDFKSAGFAFQRWVGVACSGMSSEARSGSCSDVSCRVVMWCG